MYMYWPFMLFLSVYLFVCLSVCLSVWLTVFVRLSAFDLIQWIYCFRYWHFYLENLKGWRGDILQCLGLCWADCLLQYSPCKSASTFIENYMIYIVPTMWIQVVGIDNFQSNDTYVPQNIFHPDWVLTLLNLTLWFDFSVYFLYSWLLFVVIHI